MRFNDQWSDEPMPPMTRIKVRASMYWLSVLSFGVVAWIVYLGICAYQLMQTTGATFALFK